jgi:uncharacterized membrane protein YdjX (TVP38/TMEM64 family)
MRLLILALLVTLGLAVALVPALQSAAGEALSHFHATDPEAAVAGLIEYLRSFGLWAPVVSGLLMVAQAVIAPLPAFLLTFANGMLFGWAWGAVLSWTGAMVGAALCFWIARALGRPAVTRLVSAPALAATDRFFLRFGTQSVLIARLLPFVSFDIVSYAAGLTAMPLRRFLVATGLGQLPATLLYSWLGQQATGSLKLLFWAFSIALVLAILAWMLAPVLRRRLA